LGAAHGGPAPSFEVSYLVKELTIVSDVQVTCTNKTNRYDHESITELGGFNWRRSKADAAYLIDNRINRFFTQAGPYRAWLHTKVGRNGKYVQTERDPTPENNLLNLRDC
jgi:hypothetical protein